MLVGDLEKEESQQQKKQNDKPQRSE